MTPAETIRWFQEERSSVLTAMRSLEMTMTDLEKILSEDLSAKLGKVFAGGTAHESVILHATMKMYVGAIQMCIEGMVTTKGGSQQEPKPTKILLN